MQRLVRFLNMSRNLRVVFSLSQGLSYKFKTLPESQFRKIWKHSDRATLSFCSPLSFPKHFQKRKGEEKETVELIEKIKKKGGCAYKESWILPNFPRKPWCFSFVPKRHVGEFPGEDCLRCRA